MKPREVYLVIVVVFRLLTTTDGADKGASAVGICALKQCSCEGYVHPSWLRVNCTLDSNQIIELTEESLPRTASDIELTGGREVTLGALAFTSGADVRRVRVAGAGLVHVRRHAFLNLTSASTLIEIADCGSVHIETKAFAHTKGPVNANITRCAYATIERESFSWLLSLVISEVPRLELGAGAFLMDSSALTSGRHGPFMKIHLQKVILPEFASNTFASSAAEIRLEQVEVRTVKHDAFSANTFNIVIAESSSFHRIESGAFAQKTLINNLEITKCHIHMMSSKAIQSATSNLTIQHSVIDEISAGAVNITVATEVTIRSEGPYSVLASTTQILVDGCARVFFLSDAISALPLLRTIELRNNKKIFLKERSMQWWPFRQGDGSDNPGLKILIQNSTINEIPSHAIKGRIDDVLLGNNEIYNIRPFAFSSMTGTRKIELIDNRINNLEIQAFKKFSLDNFVIRGGALGRIPSRMLSDIEVRHSFSIIGSHATELSSMAFMVTGPEIVRIENNHFGTIEGEAFRIGSRAAVTFRNNTVDELRAGAFAAMSVPADVVRVSGRQDLLIDNNTIRSLGIESLRYNRTSYHIKIDALNIDETCDCFHLKEWLHLLSTEGGIILCRLPDTSQEYYLSLPSFVDSHCGKFKENFWIFLLAALSVATLAVVVVIYCVVKKDRERKRKLNVVMPDGKTYRETELHVVIERAELLTTDM